MIRGFPALDALTAGTRRAPSKRRRALRVPAQFLDDSRPRASAVDAMLAACAELRLTTVECARAIRALVSLGCGTSDAREFLRRAHVPRRTRARARVLARADAELWREIVSGRVSIVYAELRLRGSAAPRRGPRPSSNAPRREDRLADSARQAAGPARASPPGPAWRLTRKKRLILYHRNLGSRDAPGELLAIARELERASGILRAWAGQGGGEEPGDREARPSAGLAEAEEDPREDRDR